ncbi:MAG: hypothetical protein K2R98_04705 [Gemmataceae bacterium]|nr:hypothetical protein [Gemmataceae bacterium]
MTQLTTVPAATGFGATSRRDAWWFGPLATLLGLLAFLLYANYIVFFVPGYFEIRQDRANFFKADNPAVAPYLAPFHSPLFYDAQSPHAWFHQAKPDWWPSWFPFSSAMLILIFPAGFRMTCYYYRKAYYRAFWADPPACAVGEPRKSYWGENHWPLLIQNVHRYFLYMAIVILLFLAWDALLAFRWPVVEGNRIVGHSFGVGLGTVIMWVNVVFLSGFTLGCNSLRHLVGGRMNCFACPNNLANVTGRYKAWHWVTRFNERHMLWAWLSLISVGFTDLYIRMCASGTWNDIRFF